jgi:hypothetical protein
MTRMFNSIGISGDLEESRAAEESAIAIQLPVTLTNVCEGGPSYNSEGHSMLQFNGRTLLFSP